MTGEYERRADAYWRECAAAGLTADQAADAVYRAAERADAARRRAADESRAARHAEYVARGRAWADAFTPPV